MDYTYLYKQMEKGPLKEWAFSLSRKVELFFEQCSNGNLPRWQDVYKKLPEIKTSGADINSDVITVGRPEDCSAEVQKELESLLRGYHPWRKGPYNLFGIPIESEWRSDFKWNRLKGKIKSLKDRVVLDVGCGNGYHCFRVAGEGARLSLGIDFALLYNMQFQAIQKYVNHSKVGVLPLGIDDLPEKMEAFDTVFSMGVMYHRRAPFDHLLQLKSFLRDQGELVLETLIIEGGKGEVLSPEGRYAKMPNVFFIPSVSTLESWLKRMGFTNIQLIDINQTTSDEQRVTDWMGIQSLNDFLDPKNRALTIEGYPAPRRAIFLAEKA